MERYHDWQMSVCGCLVVIGLTVLLVIASLLFRQVLLTLPG